LKLKYAINTHVHADHITGTGLLKTKHFAGSDGNTAACLSVIGENNKKLEGLESIV